MDALSDSRTISVSPSATVSPTETATSITVTPSALPVSGTTTCSLTVASWDTGAVATGAAVRASAGGGSIGAEPTASALSNSQIASPSLTSEPSDTWIAPTTPDASAGISIEALSDSKTIKVSPSATVSP